jgi:hypothetical protein
LKEGGEDDEDEEARRGAGEEDEDEELWGERAPLLVMDDVLRDGKPHTFQSGGAARGRRAEEEIEEQEPTQPRFGSAKARRPKT